MSLFTRIKEAFYGDVATITSRFESDIERLKAIAEKRRNLAVKQMEKAIDCRKSAETHKTHADRADRVASKIKNLVD